MSAERPILIVDDDLVLRETLADQLAHDGEFTAIGAGTIGEAEEMLGGKDARFDAVILDVGLPDGDGRDLCTELRKQGQKMPIIMLTGSDAETDVVRGLDSGANDYIAKPFRLAELLARLRAQLRIFENSEDAVFTIGPYTFRPSAKLLQDPGEEPPHPADREGSGDPEVPVSRRDTGGGAAGAAERGVGLQRRCHHAHAGDAHLPPAAEDRAGSGERTAAGHRGRRVSAGSRGRAGFIAGCGVARESEAHPAAQPTSSITFRRSATKARYSRAFASSSGTRSRNDGWTVTNTV